jgi:general secretion pathway protein D
VLLRALQEKRRLEVLSRPQLMALDGQPGQVQVGQDVPVILQTNIDPIAGTSNTFNYRSVGLILQVVPRISPDGLVVMQITANKSEVGPEGEGIPISITPAGQVLRAPRIDVTQALTTVSALSGQTVILGGLIQTRKSDIHRRVPLIADIPLIGDLFRYDSVAEERRELLIILTPQIIYNKLDSDLTKQIESSRMSWILSDVVNVHGEAGLRSRCDEWQDADIEAVYPTHVPEEGLLPLVEPRTIPGATPLDGPACEPPPINAVPTPEVAPPAQTSVMGDPAVRNTPELDVSAIIDEAQQHPQLQ